MCPAATEHPRPKPRRTPPRAAVRIEACPPTPATEPTLGQSLGLLWHHCIDLIRPSALPGHVRARKRQRMRELEALAAGRAEFEAALVDLWRTDTSELLDKVQTARTLQELWHLRAGVFGLVSRHHNQDEAAERLARLNQHFPTRAVRSGFAPLESTR